MRATKPTKIFTLLILFFAGSNLIYSQKPQSWFYENEVNLSVPINKLWSINIGMGYRGLLQERLEGEKVSDNQHEHIELNHFTNYRSKKSVMLSLGLRYRFREIFDSAETDEFRIIEQVGIEPVRSRLSHRFRLEQRFREQTEHRIRYELGYSRIINQVFSFEAATEVLYSLSTTLKPEAEQRFTIGLENSSFETVAMGLAFEYRIENYTQDLQHEFFIMTGVSFSL